MALDKLTIINNGGLSTTSDYRVGILTATKFVGPIESDSATFTGSVSIGGTLTYEDVTNVDSVGLITARQGIKIGSGVGVAASISVDGNAEFAGIVTATTFKGDGSNLSGISVGITTEAYVVQAVSGITTFLDLSKDDHKITASGITTVDVRGGT